jgi:superoxide dismutase, Cu-Zn family
MLKPAILTLHATLTLVIANGWAQTPSPTGTTGDATATASGTFIDAQNQPVGEVLLQQTPHGVLVKIDLTNATPGTHALHIHTVGKCDAPSFESAGGHFDTAARKHGFLNPAGHHAGDLPNLDVPLVGKLSMEYHVPEMTLERGPRPLMDGDGSALVIHAGKDDYTSDPAGASGDRLACARVTK